MEDHLSPREIDCLKQFLNIVNNDIRGRKSANAMCQRTALKFLMARKFDVTRAILLYKHHEVTRLQERLNDIDPTREELDHELNTGKFTILNVRDPQGAAIAIFTARLHSAKHRNSFLREANHQITLQGLVYQLDMALDNIQTQRSGIVFIYDMNGSDRSNFEYSFCQKLLNLLKGAYPAKLKRVLIISPPMWFKAPYQILRLLYPQKLRDRVSLVDVRQLTDLLPADLLPIELGGNYVHNHQAWLNECRRAPMDSFKDLCDKQSAQTLLDTPLSSDSNNGAMLNDPYCRASSSPSRDGNLVLSGASFEQRSLDTEPDLIGQNTSKTSYDYSENGMTLKDFIQHLKTIGKTGLVEEYRQIRMKDLEGPFWISKMPINIEKNRYIDVLCFDHSRVVLEPDLGSPASSDYINANYIDGYKQPQGFISTQGPLPNTFIDFWRMIWQTNCRVIVMVTRTFERGLKCDQYWPTPQDGRLDLKRYVVVLEDHTTCGQYRVSELSLTDTKSGTSRKIWHFQFTAWPDYGVPLSACSLLEFHEQVARKQKESIDLCSKSKYPPVVVHCSAGIGRSPTFITLDICIQRIDQEQLIDVKGTVEKLRQQRALSIQTVEQYIFCNTALLEYALGKGLLQDTDWNGFDNFDPDGAQ